MRNAAAASAMRNLADPPSPHHGRLGDRIPKLRSQCIAELGEARFSRVYEHLKREAQKPPQLYDDDGLRPLEIGGEADGYRGDDFTTRKKLMALGLTEDKLHYWQIVESLIFMEANHWGP